ncbi:MAG: hypothetical protein PHP74_03660 [Candidatus Gracilibacteria bacterium]|nr:hypothetical protein [Candidatus Gracilibacteria bacterium]
MEEENNKKKKRVWDKILMGAIIGGAIGSVVGASVKAQKKEENAEELNPEPKKIFKKFLGIFRRKEKSLNSEIKKIPNEMEEYKK